MSRIPSRPVTERGRASCGAIAASLLALVGVLACGGGDAPAPAAAPPAKVAATVKEQDLATITLTEDAARRLGIATTPVALERIARTRLYGGDLTWASEATGPGGGATALASAFPPSELLRMADLQVAADGALESARVAAEAARRTLQRTEERRAARAASDRDVEDARAQARLAEVALRNAEERRVLLGGAVLQPRTPKVLWARVPVFAGDADRLRRVREVRLAPLGDDAGASGRLARALPTSFTSAPGSVSAELLFEVPNADGALRPGERVAVVLPTGEEGESLVVPWAAVLHDIHGGTWVYEEMAPHTFVRRRVLVQDVVGDRAALANGPAPGRAIVHAGAAELFGAELGFAK